MLREQMLMDSRVTGMWACLVEEPPEQVFVNMFSVAISPNDNNILGLR